MNYVFAFYSSNDPNIGIGKAIINKYWYWYCNTGFKIVLVLVLPIDFTGSIGIGIANNFFSIVNNPGILYYKFCFFIDMLFIYSNIKQ